MQCLIKKLIVSMFIVAFCGAINIETSYGQIHMSSESLSFPLNDSNINDISDIWEKYISTNNEQEKKSIWYGDDYIEYVTPNRRMYNDGVHYTFNISQINENIYEINTISYIITNPDNLFETIENIYKACAIKIGDKWQLISYMDAHISDYKQFATPYVNYVYPHNYHFTKQKALAASKFIKSFCDEYKLEYPHIKYIVANNIDEANRMIGFVYTLWRSGNIFAGRTIYPHTILSTRENHIHEIVHAIILPNYPNGHRIFQEGIATYYGGTSGVNYSRLLELMNIWLQNNQCDFSDLESITNVHIYDDIPLTYVLGARLIDYMISKYGVDGVLTLLTMTDYISIFNYLEIDITRINDFVMNLFLG